MPSQTVCELQAPPFQVAVASSNSYFVPASVTSIGDSPRTMEDEIVETDSVGPGCVRGVRTAFLLEGCMLLVGYGIWHFLHLAH